MSLDILCEVKFNPEEEAALDDAAKWLGMTKEEVVRKAVKIFAAQCVPTQNTPHS